MRYINWWLKYIDIDIRRYIDWLIVMKKDVPRTSRSCTSAAGTLVSRTAAPSSVCRPADSSSRWRPPASRRASSYRRRRAWWLRHHKSPCTAQPRVPDVTRGRYTQTLNYTATSNNTMLVHWPLYIWYSEEGTGGHSPPRPLLAVRNGTAHPSTASVPITVLLYAALAFSFYVVNLILLVVCSS